MSNVISFLESVGQDASLRHATKEELEVALSNAQIDPALRAAIADRDSEQIAALLGLTTNVCCAVVPGREEDDESEEDPSKDDDEIRAQSSRAA